MSQIVRTKRLNADDLPQDLQRPLANFVRVLNELFSDTRQAVNGGLGVDNQNAFLATATAAMKDDWRPVSLLGGWACTDSLTPGALKGPGGHTVLRGNISGGGTNPGTRVLQVPPELTPAGVVRDGNLLIDTSGVGRLAATQTGDISLDQISFSVADARPLANPVFPVKFKNELTSNQVPKGVYIVGVQDTTDRNSAASVPCWGVPAWRAQGSDIYIDDVQGLASNRTYDITFFVLGG